jgi:transposase
MPDLWHNYPMDRKGEKRVPRRELRDTRELAINALQKGMHPDDVADLYDVGRSTVFNWRKEYLEKGSAALVVEIAPGRTPRLADAQMERLRKLVVGRDPRQLQFDFALWTRQMVRDLIKREFGVDYTPEAVGNILRGMGLSPQKPLVRAYQQNPELVARWKEEEYPAIRKEAKAAGAAIFFCDEAGIRTDYHSGTTWAPVGQTPIVRRTGDRGNSVNMISAISAQGKLHFSFLDGNLNSALFIDYLKKLMHDIPGPVFLIVDNYPSHKSKETMEFVNSTQGRLKLYFLPPYSPELNPDEWVWKSVKHDHVGKMASRSIDEMKGGIAKAVEKLQSGADRILGFFRDPDLSYIGAAVQ